MFTCLQGILDFNREFDVSLMDRVVMSFYSGAGEEVCIVSNATQHDVYPIYSFFSNNLRNKP